MKDNAPSITAYQPAVWQTTTPTRAADGVYKDDANLVSLYLFENGADLGEDSIGANDLTNNAAVSQNADHKEGSYSADFELGSSQYLSITDVAQTGLDITGDICICAWIKLESTSDAAYASKYDGASDNSYMLWNDSGVTKFSLSSDGSAITPAIGGTTLNSATWYHVAGVYDGTDIRVYVDGALDANGADNPKAFVAGIYNGAANFELGHRDGSVNYLDGRLDELAVFNRALSAAEVADIYNNGIRDVPADETSRLYPPYAEVLDTEKEQYTITDGLGFDTATFTLINSPDYLMDWYENGLVRHVVWRSPDGGTCWEGYVNRLSLSMGDRALTKSVDGMANRVMLRYTALDTSKNPPTAGAQATVTVNDTASQARYGVKINNVSGSEATDATADDLARSHLNSLKYIVSTETVTVGEGRQPSLTVEMKGYAHMANWCYYDQTVSSSTANANVVVSAVIAADENDILDTSTLNIDTNTTATEQYWDGKQESWKVIQEIADRGYESGGIGYRWHCGVYERRRVTFKAAEGLDDDLLPYSTNKYMALYRQQRDPSDAFIDEAGREWMPWELRPDRLVFTQGVPGRPMYITQVKVSMPWRVTLQGTDRTNPISGLTHIVDNLERSLRADFFAKDREVVLQDGRDGSYGAVPSGVILLWSGSVASIPAGWVLCDGNNSTPDLRNRFVIAAGDTYDPADTGGATTHTHGDGSYATDTEAAHTHGDGSYATASDSHTHTFSDTSTGPSIKNSLGGSGDPGYPDPDHTHDVSGTTGSDAHSHDVTGTSDSGGSHSHDVTGTSASGSSLPPYYALAYIMKT